MDINIVGNRIAELLNNQAAKEENPEKYRKAKLELLHSGGGKNRISGLLKGTFQISLREAIIAKEVFDCLSIDEIIIYKKV
jgi:hypothetical protein